MSPTCQHSSWGGATPRSSCYTEQLKKGEIRTEAKSPKSETSSNLKPSCRQPPAGQILKQKLPEFCVSAQTSCYCRVQAPLKYKNIYIYTHTYQFRDPSIRHMSLLTLLFHDNVLVSAGGSPTSSALLPIPVFKTYLALTLYKTHINSSYMKQHPCLRFHEMCPCDAGQHSWITQRNPAGPRIYMGARSTEVL